MAYTVKNAKQDEALRRTATDSTDWQALIDRAVSAGDYRSAAQYEQKRNAKIDAMDALDLNPNGYGKTDLYSAYLDRESLLDRSDRMDASAIEELYRQMGVSQSASIDRSVEQAVGQLEQAREDAQKDFAARQAQVSIDEAQARDRQVLYAAARGDRGGITARQYDSISNTAANNRQAIAREQQVLATDTARQIANLRAQGEFQKAEAALQLAQQQLSQLWELQQYDDSIRLQEEKLDLQTAGVTGIYKGQQTRDALQTEAENQVQARKLAYQMAMAMIESGTMPSDSLLESAGMLGEKASYQNMVKLVQAQMAVKKASGSSVGSGKTSTDAASLFEQMRSAGITDYESAYAFVSGHKNNYTDKQVQTNAENYLVWLSRRPDETSAEISAENTKNGTNGFVDVDGQTVAMDVVRAYVRLGMIRQVTRSGRTEYHWADGVAV